MRYKDFSFCSKMISSSRAGKYYSYLTRGDIGVAGLLK